MRNHTQKHTITLPQTIPTSTTITTIHQSTRPVVSIFSTIIHSSSEGNTPGQTELPATAALHFGSAIDRNSMSLLQPHTSSQSRTLSLSCVNPSSIPFPCLRVSAGSAVRSVESAKGCSGNGSETLQLTDSIVAKFTAQMAELRCTCVKCCPCAMHQRMKDSCELLDDMLHSAVGAGAGAGTALSHIKQSDQNENENDAKKRKMAHHNRHAQETSSRVNAGAFAVDMPLPRSADPIHTRCDLSERFDIRERIGSGTFSVVFRARVKSHPLNDEFHHLQQVAIKRFLTHSHPDRLETEEEYLWRFGDKKRHILPLLSSHHAMGAPPSLVLPYCPHQEFRSHYKHMSLNHIQRYLFGLLVALERLHEFHIIHRDVKPDNYLWNFDQELQREREMKKKLQNAESVPNSHTSESESEESLNGFLIDFGLAHTELKLKVELQLDHSLPNNSSSEFEQQQIDAIMQSEMDVAAAAAAAAVSTTESISDTTTEKVDLSSAHSPSLTSTHAPPLTPSTPLSSNQSDQGSSKPPPVVPRRSPRKQHVVKSFQQLQQVISTSKSDVLRPKTLPSRPIAPKGGTRGFRAPEVLSYSQDQSVAVDLWAVGTILLSILTHHYPFFSCPDDSTGLAEMMHLLDLSELRCGGQLVTFERNDGEPFDLPLFCRHSTGIVWPHELFDLLRGLLQADPAQRLSASAALRHPFMTKNWLLVPLERDDSHALCMQRNKHHSVNASNESSNTVPLKPKHSASKPTVQVTTPNAREKRKRGVGDAAGQ